MSGLEEAVRLWLTFLFSLSGIGGTTVVITKFLRSARGGLR